MAQTIKQGNIFGRIGSGIGQGIAEQAPKEVERYRLASGLKDLSESQGLSPFQQFSRLASLPGATPQMIQSGSELLRQQAQGNAYKRGAPGSQEITPESLTRSGMQPQEPMANENGQIQRSQGSARAENPLDERSFAKTQWSPQQRNERIAQYIDQGFLPEQSRDLASDDEARELGTPEVYEKQIGQLQDKQAKSRAALDRHLETKLQKNKETGLFGDITGENLINLQRAMDRDFRLNPKMDLEEGADKWSKEALNFAKAKRNLKKLGSETGIEAFFKGDETAKKLKEYSDIFKKSGNSEEMYNLLQEQFGMSPQGSASIAFPLNKNLNDRIMKTRMIPVQSILDPKEDARQIATELEPFITPNDSLLSIVQALSARHPVFNQQAFFDQIAEDKGDLGLNDRQQRELGEGRKGIIPHWGDILILPNIFRRK